jgi:hypothetical protein
MAAEVPALCQAMVDAATSAGGGTLRQLCFGTSSVPVLQLLLRLQPQRGASSLARRLLCWGGGSGSGIEEGDACTEQVAALLADTAGSHLLETALEVVSDEEYYELYAKCFRGRLLALSLSSLGNFVVQKLITLARHPAHVTALCTVSRALPSWNRSILTEIYLCHARSDHEIEDGHGRTGAAGGRRRGHPGPARGQAIVGGADAGQGLRAAQHPAEGYAARHRPRSGRAGAARQPR